MKQSNPDWPDLGPSRLWVGYVNALLLVVVVAIVVVIAQEMWG